MYVEKETGTERTYAVEKVIDDIPGGGTIVKEDFPSTTTVLKEGAVVGEDEDGKYHLVKTAKAHADSATNDIQIKKEHDFNVGDFVTDAGLTLKAYAIVSIDTSNEDYDVIDVGTALGSVTENMILVQAAAEAAVAGEGAFKYTPEGVTTCSVDLTVDNQGCGIAVRARVREEIIPYFIDANVKALLPFVQFV